jgi:CO/xanthine dehydrogenase Mo-binding subunit
MRRIEGADKVSGGVVFTEDMALAGLAHARLVLSYVASGSIRAIQVEAAVRVPGVVAVVTAKDLGLEEGGPELPLTRNRIFHGGQPVAAVVAETPAAAADAAAVVEIEYERLPAALDLEQALKTDAPRVLPETARSDDEASLHGAAAGGASDSARPVGNVTSQMELRRGDVEQALAGSAVVERALFTVARVHHGFIEPHVVTASVAADRSVTVWSPTQAMSWVRDGVADSLGLDPGRVRVIPMPVGGGFGGKIMQLEPLVARLARHVGRPVRLLLTRSDEFVLGQPAPSSQIALQLGATTDGDLSAIRAEVGYDNGAGTGWHTGITSELLVSTYRVPHFHVVGREVATNKVPATSYRAPGAPQAYFALESCVDEVARKLGADPIQFRLRNAAREGDPRADGSPWPAIGLTACLEAAARHPAYLKEKDEGEGVGVAAGSWIGGFGPAAAACRVESDGTLALHLGSIDISGSDTGFAALAAEVFGMSPERVRVLRTDSITSPVSPIAGGSSTTYSVGPAVIQAVIEARRQVLEVAGSHFEVDAGDLEVADGEVRVKGAPFRAVSVAELAAAAQSGKGRGPIHAIGRAAPSAPAPMFGVHIARVKVDRLTGAVRVGRYVAIHDIGRALNRAELVAQIHGGVVQGLGRALGEELVYDNEGQLRTGSLADYMLPTVDLAPDIEVELVEVPSEQGPLGARGIGEPPAVPVLAAIANAIRDATGLRLTGVPFSLEAVAGRGDQPTLDSFR